MQIIVVEGIHDVNKIKEVYKDALVVTTNGKETSEETLKMLIEYSQNNELILFLDPDYPGESIRKKIMALIPNAKHAFLPKHLCISNNKRKVGIEHASASDVKKALDNVYQVTKRQNTIDYATLFKLGLTGGKDSKLKRDYVAQVLNIGAPNAKTFLERLNSFGISVSKVKEILKNYGSNS